VSNWCQWRADIEEYTDYPEMTEEEIEEQWQKDEKARLDGIRLARLSVVLDRLLFDNFPEHLEERKMIQYDRLFPQWNELFDAK